MPRFVRELQEFVRIPSVSGDPRRAQDVKRCAEWLAKQLGRAGLDRVRVLPTPRHPIVYAEWLRARHNPTVLLYGHYDVQPAEPLRDWKFPAYGAEIRDGFLHGRGASDDKGQLFTHVKAIEALLKTGGRLPVNVKCLFEGEEEIGSPHLPAFLTRNRQERPGRVRDMVRDAVVRYGFHGVKIHGHEAMPTREVCEAAREFGLPLLVDVLGKAHVIDMFAPQ